MTRRNIHSRKDRHHRIKEVWEEDVSDGALARKEKMIQLDKTKSNIAAVELQQW